MLAGRSALFATISLGLVLRTPQQLAMFWQQWLRAIEHEHRDGRPLVRPFGAPDPLGLDLVAGLAKPAVSTSVTGTPPRSTRSTSRSRVVPGVADTIARSSPPAG